LFFGSTFATCSGFRYFFRAPFWLPAPSVSLRPPDFSERIRLLDAVASLLTFAPGARFGSPRSYRGQPPKKPLLGSTTLFRKQGFPFRSAFAPPFFSHYPFSGQLALSTTHATIPPSFFLLSPPFGRSEFLFAPGPLFLPVWAQGGPLKHAQIQQPWGFFLFSWLSPRFLEARNLSTR